MAGSAFELMPVALTLRVWSSLLCEHHRRVGNGPSAG